MADASDRILEALLQEKRQFAPPKEFAKKAHVASAAVYRKATARPRAVLGGFREGAPVGAALEEGPRVEAAEGQVVRRRQAQRVGQLLDRHLAGPRRNKAALIWEGEPGDQRTLTYRDLYREVCKFANVLRKLGVKKGDRVTLYLPMIPELPIAMLACARIGAIHSVVFGGFSRRVPPRPHQRPGREGARDGRRRLAPGKRRAPQADRRRGAPGHALDRERSSSCAGPERRSTFREGREHWWHRLMEQAPAHVQAGADGRRGSALHPLYLGHDGQAQGDPPHDRRLPRRHATRPRSGSST